MIDSVKQGDRPQPGREPSIQTVFVLTKIIHRQSGVSCFLFGFSQRFFGSSGYHIATFRQEVSRNTMPPPQLAADTPVFDVLHPVAVCILIFGRIEFQLIVHYRRQCHIGKMLHFEEPLHRQFRFDHYIGTFRVTYFICVGFCLFEQSGSIEVFLNLLADVETIHTDI